jgi:hypothetical protein
MSPSSGSPTPRSSPSRSFSSCGGRESERSFLREVARFFSHLFPGLVRFSPSLFHRRIRKLRAFLEHLRREVLLELTGEPETLVVDSTLLDVLHPRQVGQSALPPHLRGGPGLGRRPIREGARPARPCRPRSGGFPEQGAERGEQHADVLHQRSAPRWPLRPSCPAGCPSVGSEFGSVRKRALAGRLEPEHAVGPWFIAVMSGRMIAQTKWRKHLLNAVPAPARTLYAALRF